ncbi:MAG: hypothetical protein AAF960_10385 [Bacteroidota bacterium]
MTVKIEKILTLAFCAFWMGVIFLEYWYYHPGYDTAIRYFQYWDTLAILGVVGGIFFGLTKKKVIHKWGPFLFGGIGLYLGLMIISATILWTHYPKLTNEMLDIGSGLAFLGKITGVLLAVYLIFMACYVLGSLFIKRIFVFPFEKLEGALVKIALGTTFFSIYLTILAFVNLLTVFAVLPPFLLVLGIGWRTTLTFLQSTLWQSFWSKENISWLGFTCGSLLLIFISLIFLSNIRPFPFGFDALAIYLNLPNLLSQKGGFIEGYSPYYWSLFMALGHLIFDQTPVTIGIAVTGGLLSTIAVFTISKKWLDVNQSLLVAVIFYSLPLVNYQSFRDIKTDLGLLFILLTGVLLLMKWLELEEKVVKKGQEKTGNTANQTAPFLSKYLSETEQLIVLIGLLSGMALGIKLTGLLLVFGVLTVLSFVLTGKIGFVANGLLTFFIVLAGGLDTSLRPYHFGADSFKWLVLLLGVGTIGYVFIKNRQQFVRLVKLVAIYTVLVGLVYAPWPLKNFKETGEISIKTFIEGKPIGIPDD